MICGVILVRKAGESYNDFDARVTCSRKHSVIYTTAQKMKNNEAERLKQEVMERSGRWLDEVTKSWTRKRLK